MPAAAARQTTAASAAPRAAVAAPAMVALLPHRRRACAAARRRPRRRAARAAAVPWRRSHRPASARRRRARRGARRAPPARPPSARRQPTRPPLRSAAPSSRRRARPRTPARATCPAAARGTLGCRTAPPPSVACAPPRPRGLRVWGLQGQGTCQPRASSRLHSEPTARRSEITFEPSGLFPQRPTRAAAARRPSRARVSQGTPSPPVAHLSGSLGRAARRGPAAGPRSIRPTTTRLTATGTPNPKYPPKSAPPAPAIRPAAAS
mmetsp:Transcript_18491/g.57399  ORF Transcript_18491/g.57399 Transcript_18491/m.57399 type:complete len:264 (+) Transcript_18491:1595-2386(+)